MAPISQSLSQAANARVNKVLAPQLQQQTSYGDHQNAVIRAFANSLLGKLQPVAGQVGADYDAAIKQVGSLSGQAAQYLSGQNPAVGQQQLESSVGAPAEQQAQAAQQLSNTFKGGAGVLAFTQGVVPGSELAGNKAAAMAQARQLPGIAALAGQQSLSSALYTQSQDRAKLEAQRPGLVQAEEKSIQSANLTRAATKQRADAAAAATKQRADAAQAKLNQRAGEIDPAVSKLSGVLTYSDGTHAKDAKGNDVPVVQGAGKSLHYQDAYGREVIVGADGKQQVLSEGKYTDSAGTTWRVGLNGKQTVVSRKPEKAPTPHYTTVSDATGTYVVNEDTGDKRKVAGPKVSAPSTSAPTTKKINGVTYQWDAARKGWVKSGLPADTAANAPTVHGNRQWDPKTKTWIKAPGLPATSTSSRPLTPSQRKTYTGQLNNVISGMLTGGKDPKTGKDHPALSYHDALAYLDSQGWLSSPQMRKLAIAMLRKHYGSHEVNIAAGTEAGPARPTGIGVPSG